MESRQVRRAKERQAKKTSGPKYPHGAQRGGPSRMLTHRNRKHRDDGNDYFRPQ